MENINKVIIVLLTTLVFACVTTKELPSWIEVKPANTKKEIFFAYGPAESRDSAKKGLYKEISEYFGVKVSSVDKFIKNVSVENGERDINQSTDSVVDVESRNKGLDSIQIRETWGDEVNNRWCMLASIDTKSEALIRKQVAKDIEDERIESVLSQGELYSIESADFLEIIDNNISTSKKILLNMQINVDKIYNMADDAEIILKAESALLSVNKIDKLINETKSLTNKIKINHKKNSLLRNQVTGLEIPEMELDFFILENLDILTNAEIKLTDMTKLELDVDRFSESLNRALLKAEISLLGNEETQKKNLEKNLTTLTDLDSSLQRLMDDNKLMLSNSEDYLRKLKQNSYSKSISPEEQKIITKDLMEQIENILESATDNINRAYNIKSDFEVLYNETLQSNFLDKVEKNRITKLSNQLDSPISWIEIYQEKISVILNNGKKIVDDILVKDIVNIRLEEFSDKLSKTVNRKLDITIAEFTIEDSEISSSFSNYIKGKLLTEIGKNRNFDLIDYKDVTDYMNKNNINPNSLYKTDNTDDIKIVKNIIYGDYWINEGVIELKVNLKNIDSNKILFSESLILPKDSIPNNIELKPSNYDSIIALDKQLNITNEVPKNSVNFGFQVWPNKGSGATYRDGENMIINIVTPVAGYVKVYHISADNELTLIFPNKYDKMNWFSAGTHYTIGDSSYPFEFKLGKPYGTESLKAVFSLTQFDDLIEGDFRSDFLYSGVRGINIKSRIKSDMDLDRTVVVSYYTITE